MNVRLCGAGRKWGFTGRAAVALIGAAALFWVSGNAFAEIVYFVNSLGEVQPVDTNNPGEHAMTAKSGTPMKAGPVTFNVVYNDVVNHTARGFDDPTADATYGTVGAARRAAIQRVLGYLGPFLNENGSCDVLFSNSGQGTSRGLASGGTYFGTGPGLFTNGYAFSHITTGVDPSPATADVSLTFYFDWPWYAGTGSPAYNQYDLDSVFLHEFTRSLGIISLSDASGHSISPPVLSRWDDLLETTGTHRKLFNSSTGAFQGTPSDLTGGDGGISFTGVFATAFFGSKPPVYAPSTFQVGKSLGHWTSGGKIAGNAVMEPNVTAGEVMRQYALVDIGALKDIGYIHIITPLVFTDYPRNGWYQVGERIEMRVAALGTFGTVRYQWLQDDVAIPGSTTSTYVIDPAALYDTDNYRCVLTDDSGVGGYDSPTAHIDVYPEGALPTTGIIGLAIVAVACIIAGAFIILRRE
jgi:hypothetical protein